MALDTKDLEALKQFVYAHGDDMAISIARSFERLEERMDTVESRINTRLSELEDLLISLLESVTNRLDDIRTDIAGVKADEE